MSKIITKDGPRLNAPNLNGRIYPQNDFEVGLRAYNKVIDADRAYGELGHPESDVISLDNCSHIVRDVRIVKARLPRKKKKAMKKIGKQAEITRFKGLGEISPDEFENFIKKDIRLNQVEVQEDTTIDSTLSYYMGTNTPDRQKFIINNLKVEQDKVDLEEDELVPV